MKTPDVPPPPIWLFWALMIMALAIFFHTVVPQLGQDDRPAATNKSLQKATSPGPGAERLIAHGYSGDETLSDMPDALSKA
jgi:hypothetical protein